MLTDEFDQTARMHLPKRLADGRNVFLGATMFHRNRLPAGFLQANVFPIVIAPKLTEINMVLPLAFWPVTLRDNWEELKEQLTRGSITTTAKYVAQEAEKRAIEDRGPDWDIRAIPIKVTKAMAKEFRSMVREMDLETSPFLFVGFRDDGRKGADLVLRYDPSIEQSFTSNGIKMVVRKDQLERLRGAIVDFKCSAFAKGIVIRLPGE
jgi:Fe-S cluster assembly iron-binding protein IscA